MPLCILSPKCTLVIILYSKYNSFDCFSLIFVHLSHSIVISQTITVFDYQLALTFAPKQRMKQNNTQQKWSKKKSTRSVYNSSKPNHLFTFSFFFFSLQHCLFCEFSFFLRFSRVIFRWNENVDAFIYFSLAC